MPEVRAIEPFVDTKCKVVRQVGSEFFCDGERAKQLAAYGMVEIIGGPSVEPEQEPKPKPKPKRTSKKKAE